MKKTNIQYDHIITSCKEVFVKKNKDYGQSWRILRPSSLTDQLYIKASRIRSIEESGLNAVGESVENEFVGLYNYSIIAIVQLRNAGTEDLSELDLIRQYDAIAEETKQLMTRKNADYGEVWRQMRISSMTDLILQKLQRIKQIEDNNGLTIISEGLEANYTDIMNYAVFALIRLSENKNNNI